MHKRFLLTFSFENREGMYDGDYKWYESEEAMKIDIEDMKEYIKDFKIVDALEVISVRKIKLE